MRKLIFTAPRQVAFEDVEDVVLGPKTIRLQTLYSAISHGTEMNFYRGTAPHFTHRIDNGLFTKLDQVNAAYPVWFGYETVGRVIELGSEVTDYALGDVVWAGLPHADQVTCETTIEGRPGFCQKAPPGANPQDGIFLALAGVALDGHLTAQLRLGEAALISGLGCIGLFCVQMAKRAGVHPIIAVDPLPLRREMALQHGADYALDPLAGPIAEQVLALNQGRGVDAAIETSGNWGALHESIRCCASQYGRVVALGFYQGGGSALRLGEEFHHSSFYPVGASSILALKHRGQPGPGKAWDDIRVYHLLAQMLGDGRLKTDGLLTQTFPFEQAAQALELVDKHPENVIKVALTFE